MENTEKKVIEYTPAQKAAMNARGRTLLVSAAAGSGKTFTLTQRIIKEIIEEDRDISRMLIVTFTRAAAADLQAKISSALEKAIEQYPENSEKLQGQIVKLASANISTIDSFFTHPVKANFEKLGLPASIRLSDEAELSSMREEIMHETIEEYFLKLKLYDDAKLSGLLDQSSYTDLLSIISTARDSSDTIPTLIEIYKKLMTSPLGVEQLRQHADRMSASASLDFFDTEEGKLIKKQILNTVRYVKRSFEKCIKDFEEIPFVKENYLSCFIFDCDKFSSLLEALEPSGFSDAAEVICSFSWAKIPSISEGDKTDESRYYHKLREKLKNKFRDLTSYFSDTQEQISQIFIEMSTLCRTTYEILSEFDRSYCAAKLQKAVCEFSDMPKFMLRLLQNPDGTPSKYCLSLRESFDEVYIDEYQDVNEIQDTIFSLIGGDKRFMVGDIKQSIYGFREAEPSIFAGYRNRFTEYDENDPTSLNKKENKIFMSSNFRCDKNIIKFTNLVCSKVFSTFADSIEYTKKDDLEFAKLGLPNGYISPRVKINLVHKPEKTAEENELDEIIEEQEDIKNNKKELSEAKALSDEACIVANEIAELLKNGKKPDGKPIKGSDIAVLVRFHKHARPLMLALDRMNISYTSSSGKSSFSDYRMTLLVDLLSVIDNPRSDIPLYRLLSGEAGIFEPIFSLEELINIRQKLSTSKSLYDAMIYCSAQQDGDELSKKCSDFVEEIKRLRRLAAKLSADKLLRALASVDIYTVLTDSEAFIILYDKACKYVQRSWNGLSSFLSYIKKTEEVGDSSADCSKSSGDEVNILSMHQSKGLEYSACFLFGMGKQKNEADSKKALVYTKELGISAKLPAKKDVNDPIGSLRIRYTDNVLWKAAALLNKEKLAEEEARILYVALTRARERLYISASVNEDAGEVLLKAANTADIEYAIQNAKSFMDILFLTLCDREWDNEIFYSQLTEKGTAEFATPINRLEIKGESEYSEYELGLAELFCEGCKTSDENTLLSTVPSKVAASKVSSTMLDNSVFLPIPVGKLFEDELEDISEQKRESEKNIKNRIDLMRSQSETFDGILAINQKPTAAEKGTATHLFLQYCDYENADRNGIDAEIERLLSMRFISQRTATAINKTQLEGFLKSELFGYIRSASKVRREFKFGMFRPASEFTQNPKLRGMISDKKIFVQGSIDLILESENGDLILCDYKTDRISKEERSDRSLLLSKMKERHGEQLEQYKYAVRQIFGKDPSKIYIYSVTLGEIIEIK